MLSHRGTFYLNTVNRFTLATDPYAYLWGVGFLPRAWQARYVRWRRQSSYEQIKPLSLRELNRLAEKYFATKEIALPDVDAALLPQFSPLTHLQIRLYKKVRRLPRFSSLLKWVGPSWDVKFQKN